MISHLGTPSTIPRAPQTIPPRGRSAPARHSTGRCAVEVSLQNHWMLHARWTLEARFLHSTMAVFANPGAVRPWCISNVKAPLHHWPVKLLCQHQIHPGLISHIREVVLGCSMADVCQRALT